MIKKENCISIEGSAENWEEAIQLCGQKLQDNGKTEAIFTTNCIEREKEYPTGLPATIPVAIPHSISEGINESSICFLRLKEPVEFKRMDNDEESIVTNLIFNLAIKDSGDHIQFLQKLMGFLMDEKAVKQCLNLEIQKVNEYLQKNLVI